MKVKHNPEWHKQRAIERKQVKHAIRTGIKNRCKSDLEELEKEFAGIVNAARNGGNAKC